VFLCPESQSRRKNDFPQKAEAWLRRLAGAGRKARALHAEVVVAVAEHKVRHVRVVGSNALRAAAEGRVRAEVVVSEVRDKVMAASAGRDKVTVVAADKATASVSKDKVTEVIADKATVREIRGKVTLREIRDKATANRAMHRGRGRSKGPHPELDDAGASSLHTIRDKAGRSRDRRSVAEASSRAAIASREITSRAITNRVVTMGRQVRAEASASR
jgi:hypothetical protein